ncbi:MAG: hypothetical protein A2744_00035 [Candidatus Buchananbacteria bacterium RIFCSPHIGHO2_01_FULL_44_11]|uniref:Helix-turn-helix domain-containing protein n=1 Tax=Candidatus Buchananbacteria bacterium RIFCSPHIGHO2_01_FULL_44_11 TaxID=1797535 RepID=A0A1G1Y2F9_9BACT|nr:MAG: hypothetical protein A2744_00035 [Candidatus Buchananbacteria bacterium RIFCSPHIGHO2_01_FULL_44_11]
MRKKKFLTIEKVAKHLQIGERSVYRYVKEGKLRASKIGYWRITEKDLRDFIKESTNTSK